MFSLFYITDILLGFLEFMMGVYAIFSLLVFFGILKPHGRIPGLIWMNLQGLFEPLLRPIRRVIPVTGGFDWSFMVLYLAIILVRMLLREYGPLGGHAIVGLPQ